MSVIEFRQLYGLEISDSIDKATDGKKKIPVGSLYPILKRLESRGFVKSEWGESTEAREGARRRYYSLTGVGRSMLTETRAIRAAVNAYSQPVGSI
ncbi:transcriptional regulator [Leptolyngbya sp. Heron Island J]|uniref:PadR family transcriptional regulator n=1 Tax=Leptolyngbya sp. Heron Island J TaxID=1385935 RepID=UPI0003B93C53|nr:transcriptional regulator [Leptolyngbya sp. Heron Island J]